MPSGNRIIGLDGIRALSILLVLSCHILNGVTAWSEFGAFGVESFFVLSGFLITWLLCLEEDKRGAISLPSFYARRSLRILPPALLCVASTALLAMLGWADLARNEPLYSIFFVRNIMPNGGLHLAHFWSLAIEEQFYLLWPVAFLLLRSNRRRLVFTVALLVLAPLWRYAVYRMAGGAMSVNSWRFDLRYDGLMMGCCLALLRHDSKFREWAARLAVRPALGAFLALGAIVAGCAGLPLRAFSPSLSFLGVAAFIHFSIECPKGVLGSFLNCGPMVWLGQLSYSLYLWQQVFCWHSMLPWLGQFPQNVAASLTVATLSFYLLERPLMAIRKRVPESIKIKLPHVPAGGIAVGAGQFAGHSEASVDLLMLLKATRSEPSNPKVTAEVKTADVKKESQSV
jgi:peptidoglycan/LPS O-acetylase OafA/YrhL